MATKKKAPKKAKKLPRQDSLPGMKDTKIAAIEKLALDYAELRDERMAVGQQEVEVKEALIKAMHKAGKTEYKRNGISVLLTVEKEKIKVRVKDESEGDGEPAKKADVEVSEEPEPGEVEESEDEQAGEVAEG